MKTLLFLSLLTIMSGAVCAQSAISVHCPSDVRAGDKFDMMVLGNDKWTAEQFNAAKYLWVISSGKIVGRNDGTTLSVDSTGAEFITATVEISGVSRDPVSASCSTGVIARPKARLLSEPSPANVGMVETTLDMLFIELQNDPTSTGVVAVYARNAAEKVRLEKMVSKRIKERAFDASRITVKANKATKPAFKLWVVPDGADQP